MLAMGKFQLPYKIWLQRMQDDYDNIFLNIIQFVVQYIRNVHIFLGFTKDKFITRHTTCQVFSKN